jgi:hypothetical protein
MVEGMGTARVMWAVPSGSKVAESCEASWFGLLQLSADVQIKSVSKACLVLAMKGSPPVQIPQDACGEQ